MNQPNLPLGSTRTVAERNYALIAPDSRVRTALSGWDKAMLTVQISPRMGAKFLQYLAHMDGGATSGPAPESVQRFVYVMSGQVTVKIGAMSHQLNSGGYAWLPPGEKHSVATSASGAAELLIFEKDYAPLPGVKIPGAIVGEEKKIKNEPFMGDPDVLLKLLIPAEPAYDMAINIFTYNPGATLPQVESHHMEHGMIFLQGAGVYRLDKDWHPVMEGDTIWIGPYCPQWFVCSGKTQARYIYYKDMHRRAE